MREKNVEGIIGRSESLATSVENLTAKLSAFKDTVGQSFDVRHTIRGTDSSLSQVIGRILAAVGIIAEFRRSTRFELVPLSILSNLDQSVSQNISSIDALVSVIDGFMISHGGLQNFDYTTFVIQTRNGNLHNVESFFQSVFSNAETLVLRLFECAYILKPRSAYSFQAAASGLTSVVDRAYENLRSLEAALAQVSISEESLKRKDEEATAHLDEIKRLKTDSDSDRKTVADYLAQATQQRISVQSVSEEAEKLHITVKNYQTSFDQFQIQLNNREESFESGDKALTELISSFNNQKIEIEGIISRSEQMLSSATVAGLAANFSSMMNKLSRDLKWARFSFYVSIIFLTISAFPLFAFVGMPLIVLVIKIFWPNIVIPEAVFGHGDVQNSWQYLGQVLARITILLPAAWLVSFAAIRHSSLFRLREHYAYKYSMAVAVEGFKQQSPYYDQEIAALVLEQLAFNPADKLVPSKDIKEGKVPGIAGYLLERIKKRVDGSGGVTER